MPYDLPGTKALGRLAGWSVDHARLVLAGWVLVAGILNVAVPQLEQVVGKDSTPFLPESTPSIAAYREMDTGFGSGKAEAPAFVVVTGDQPVDDAYYRTIVQRLRASPDHVAEVQDYVRTPQLRQALVSDDGRATYIPVALIHPVGSPEADKDIEWLRDTVTARAPPGSHAYVTGDSATVADLDTSLTKNIARITVVSVFLIVLILLFLYRNWLTPLIPLATMGIALLVARGTVAFSGEHVFKVSTYTGAFLTALVLGAATDYTIFLISRYHEAFRTGSDPRDAAVVATERMATVLIASAATVIIGSACLVTARLALFHTTGPAIAIAVFTTLLVSLTFTPALLGVAGTRINPRGSAARSLIRWKRIGDLVAAHPARIALAALFVLGALAALYPTMDRTYDTRDLVPTGSGSDHGYHAIDGHFPSYELRPDYLLIKSDHDMRNTHDLSVIDGVTVAIGKIPGVLTVRSATRPEGKPIPQAQLPYGVGQVGSRLDQAGDEVKDGSKQTDKLATGANQLSSGANQLSSGAGQATSAVDQFLAGLQEEAVGLDSAVDGTGTAQTGSKQLRDGARMLQASLNDAHDQTQTAVNGLGQIYTALSADVLCTADPICNQSRASLGDIYVGERDRLLPGLATAADAAGQIADGSATLADALGQLRSGLAQARSGIDELAAGEREFKAKLGTLANGAHELAAGASQIPAGVSQIQGATDKLAAGLDEAAGFLTGTAKSAQEAGIDTFYLPPGAIDDPRFALAKSYYVSKDGRTARLLIFGDNNEHRPGDEAQTARRTVRDTSLEGATVHMTGPLAVTHDIHSLADADFHLVALVVLIAVLLILLLLLRSIVAPLYLLGSVVLSYTAAMGVTTLIWNHILGKPMDWTVPLLSFIVLVAVGADYNILLMSRVREESVEASRRGVSRAVSATGGVITSAGLIFAGTFVAMATAPMLGLGETGTAVAIGLLLDTFIVRSMLVPSIAALLGPWNWWPGARSLRHRHVAAEDRA